MATHTAHTAAREYFSVLLRMHQINPHGVAESEELDALCIEMERLWPRMSAVERELARGLSEDLYAIADGRQGVAMTEEQIKVWEANLKTTGDATPEEAFAFYRKPFPASVANAAAKLAFAQGRCWEGLGEDEVAYVFISESAKGLASAESYLLYIQHRLGRTAELTSHATAIIGRSNADSQDLYRAAAALYTATEPLGVERLRPVQSNLVDPLRRVLKIERRFDLRSRENPGREGRASRLLAICLFDLNRVDESLALCDRVISTYPNDCRNYYLRGIFTLKAKGVVNEYDFEQAADCEIQSATTYAVLSLMRLRQKKYFQVNQLTNRAFNMCPSISPTLRAILYEMRGMASAMLGQSPEWVEEEFRQALAVAPEQDHPRIKRNWAEAVEQMKARAGIESSRLEGFAVELGRTASFAEVASDDERSDTLRSWLSKSVAM